MLKKGFTLAEVLITIGIIGVVAALTMPVLMSNYKKKEYSSRLKKVYSSLSQAILLSENRTGTSSLDWDRNSYILNDDGDYDSVENDDEIYNFFMNYFAPVLNYTSIEKGTFIQSDGTEKFQGTRVYLSDGVILTFVNGLCFDIRADLNGNRLPDKEGYDMYRFLLCSRSQAERYFGNKNKSFGTYHPALFSNRNEALAKCKETPAYCSSLLIMDNWEFKKDYPYKL